MFTVTMPHSALPKSVNIAAKPWQQTVQNTLRQVNNPSPAFKQTALSGLKTGGMIGVTALGIGLSAWLRSHGNEHVANVSLLLNGAWTFPPFSRLFDQHLNQVTKLLKR